MGLEPLAGRDCVIGCVIGTSARSVVVVRGRCACVSFACGAFAGVGVGMGARSSWGGGVAGEREYSTAASSTITSIEGGAATKDCTCVGRAEMAGRPGR